ncbi:hypothetical protein GCM10009611_15020 [Arthrobacter roseus]
MRMQMVDVVQGSHRGQLDALIDLVGVLPRELGQYQTEPLGEVFDHLLRTVDDLPAFTELE